MLPPFYLSQCNISCGLVIFKSNQIIISPPLLFLYFTPCKTWSEIMFIESDSWGHRNLSTMKILSTFLRSSDQMRLLLTEFCSFKSHYYANASLQTLITKLVEKNQYFLNGVFLKPFSVYRFWSKVILCVCHSLQKIFMWNSLLSSV